MRENSLDTSTQRTALINQMKVAPNGIVTNTIHGTNKIVANQLGGGI